MNEEAERRAQERFAAELSEYYPTQYGTNARWDQLSETFRNSLIAQEALKLDQEPRVP